MQTIIHLNKFWEFKKAFMLTKIMMMKKMKSFRKLIINFNKSNLKLEWTTEQKNKTKIFHNRILKSPLFTQKKNIH